jgi:small-conductance mechanosensitive channel
MRVSVEFKIYSAIALVLALAVGLSAWLHPAEVPTLFDFLSEDTRRVLSKPLFKLGGLPVSLLLLSKAFIYLVLLSITSRMLRLITYHRLLARTRLDQQHRYLLSRSVSMLVFGFGLFFGAEFLGIDPSTVAVLGGTLGIGIGFGLQPLASNFVAGLVLLYEQPVRIGDLVEIGGTLGEVFAIAGRSTWVKTIENKVVMIPNSDLITKRVTNWTATDPRVRLILPVSVAYRSEMKIVCEALLEIAKRHEEVLIDPAPEVIFTSIGESALNLSLWVWTTARKNTTLPRLQSSLYFSIFQGLTEKGIEMPYPQRDLHIRSTELASDRSLTKQGHSQA